MEKNCRICNGNLIQFISFGKMPVANAYVSKKNLNDNNFKEYFYDMEVGFCENCKMVQLINLVPYDKYIVPDETGKTHYAFFSSTSSVMEQHFKEIANEIEQRFLNDNSKILEIGCNDGIFLQNFESDRILGIEPSHNVAEFAVSKGIPVVTEFFSEELARKISEKFGKFKAIFSANVTLNIIEIHELVEGIKNLLEDNGVFITEDPYLIDILEKNSYDQIYDEHIWYFSLTSLSNLFAMHNMEIFDAERTNVHSGSMKVYVCKKGMHEKTERLRKYIQEEKQKKIDSLEVYLEFAYRVEHNKKQLQELIKKIKLEGKRIVGYAAASKGTIIQNYCDLTNEVIEYISDSTLFKQGLLTPGKYIPIVNPDVFHNDNPEYAFIFAWNHAKEIISKEHEFLKKGGRFILHLPEPRIIGNVDDIEKRILDTPIDTTQFSELIEGVEIKKLKIFANDQGYLFETLRNDDALYKNEFGQILVSEIYPGVIKGYHLHEKHDEYTICVKGNVKYIAVKEYPNGTRKINTFIIGERNPMLIKVPRGVWHGYMPLENKSAMLVYMMSRPYNQKDPDTQEKDVFAFGDLWSVKHG